MGRTTTAEETMSLPEAARVLGVSWGQAWRLVLTRELDARQDGRGRWRVTVSSVERLQNGRHGAPPVPRSAAARTS